MTTLGMPASSSTAKPSGREIQRGSRSVRAKAQPTEIGRAMMTAMTDVWRVPAISGQAPYSAPMGWATPSVWVTPP